MWATSPAGVGHRCPQSPQMVLAIASAIVVSSTSVKAVPEDTTCFVCRVGENKLKQLEAASLLASIHRSCRCRLLCSTAQLWALCITKMSSKMCLLGPVRRPIWQRACCQGWQLELELRTHVMERETNPASCLLISSCIFLE